MILIGLLHNISHRVFLLDIKSQQDGCKKSRQSSRCVYQLLFSVACHLYRLKSYRSQRLMQLDLSTVSLADYFAYHSNSDMCGGAQEARNFPVLHDLSNWVAETGIH